MPIQRHDLKTFKRILVKVGTSVITKEDGTAALHRVGNLVEQLSHLVKAGKQVILVSSGAVGLGRKKIRQQSLLSAPLRHAMENIEQQFVSNPRACAAAGQSNLMSLYEFLFGQKDVLCSQVLVTDDDFSSETRRRNVRNTLNNLLDIGIVPILNENDVVSDRTTPLRDEKNFIFWDNDSLSTLISSEVKVDIMIVLSDVEGLYRTPPSENVKPEIIHTFTGKDNFTLGSRSKVGRGGMHAKIDACLDALEKGVKAVVVCSGHIHNTVVQVLNGEIVGTLFIKNPGPEISPGRLASDARNAGRILASLSNKERSNIALAIADALIKNKEQILQANRRDVETAKANNLESTLQNRLELTSAKLLTLSDGIKQIAREEPLGKVLKKTEISEGLQLSQITVPLGVLLVIFESRPDVLPQVCALSILSGNALLLKGGKEAEHSNTILHQTIVDAIIKGSNHMVPPEVISLLKTRSEIHDLLQLDDKIDLVIPRGSASLVKFIKQHTRIPVMGHSEGICHVFVDIDANIEKAIKIVEDSKTNYPAACNSAETVLLHRYIPLESQHKLVNHLKNLNVSLYGGPRAANIFSLPRAASFKVEYSSNSMTVEIVDNLEEAIHHINTHSSGHTDTIVTENEKSAQIFLNQVDSACVFHNASTRFADGYRFGLGAEIGISTTRYGPRGPVGIEGLLTTKWMLISDNWHTVSEFSKGEKKYSHKSLLTAKL